MFIPPSVELCHYTTSEPPGDHHVSRPQPVDNQIRQ